MTTVGDIGHVDTDGYLYLTDRASFMIISGGVNIYPQECENLLVTHPQVADAAVFGVPNDEMGEEVKAVVQLMPGIEAGPEIEAELIAFCRDHLAHHKCPRSVDFEAQLPRLPTGKLYKGRCATDIGKATPAGYSDVDAPARRSRRMTQPTPDASRRYASFREFYPFYLDEHRNAACRRLHVIGSALVLIALGAAIVTRNPWLLMLMPVIGYGFAWVGHFAFEKNRPATFSLSAVEPDGRLGDVRRGRRRPQAVLKAHDGAIMSASALRIDVLGMPNSPP